ncbi:hypothetical protein C8A03DRAFT_41341 [Achaetomium macrosporum]|uniref:Nephrocystin 3-like N-terminal domain-containing protein n=1 Tax=Achaetomium macrosporum TaxID=79813 RepID=A0AAN7CFJ4_9PEZI|nr:hypothetical protein C8A03DRAFT_41341 [Achaetomium macrosporum]
MDPVSLALAIAGLLPLIAKAINSAKEYRDAVVTAKDSIAGLINELEALQFSVSNLQQFLNHDTITRGNIRFQQTSVLLACCQACDAKLRSVCRKLGREESGKRSRFLWPFSKRDHEKTVQELRNFTIWMHFALSVDGCRLLSQTADDVLRLLGQQLEQFKAIQSLEKTTLQIHDTLTGQMVMLENSLAREQQRDILDWISTTGYFQKHQSLPASRARNTGSWILHSQEYTRWRDGADETSVLWCEGIQGSGKTNLVYYYFDHQDQSSHAPSTVLACMLRQLLARLPAIPGAVSTVYESRRSQGSLPQYECERLVAELIREVGRVYLVVDALDECDAQHRAPFLQVLGELNRISEFRLLVTSRPHTRGIAAAFTNHLNINIVAREQDIRLYRHQELARKSIYEIAGEAFANGLIERLAQGANGMFLLPVLQLWPVFKEPTLGEMEDSLNNLSHDINEVFEGTIRRIQALPASRSRIGIESLMYLVHAARPITVQELSDLLAMHPCRTRVHIRYRSRESMILECCQELVTIDPKTGYVRTSHCSASGGDDEVQAALANFFASKRAMATANQVRQFLLGYMEVYGSAEESPSLTALHHACRHGLLRTASRLLDDGISVNALSEQGSTAVIHAAAHGHVELLKLLVQKGADPNQRNWYGNALHCALIVSWGMDPSDPTYLTCAVFSDAAGAFEALVDLGADVNAGIAWSDCDPKKCNDEDHWTHIFFFACASGSYNVVDLMIRRGWADVGMRSDDGRSALD